MHMNSKTRGKALIGVALAIASYVMFGPADAPTVEAARNNPTPAAVRGPHAKVVPAQNAMRSLLLLAHRVSDTAASGALFATHSWYVPPPPPPPAPSAPTAESLTPLVPTAP